MCGTETRTGSASGCVSEPGSKTANEANTETAIEFSRCGKFSFLYWHTAVAGVGTAPENQLTFLGLGPHFHCYKSRMMWEFSNAQLIIMENFTSGSSGFENIFYHPKSDLCPYTVQTQK